MPMGTLPLPQAFATLEKRLVKFPCAPAHFVADRSLIDLAIDIAEHSCAVLTLSVSTVPRTAYSNARSAFESALDILYLTIQEGTYDDNGCAIRAFTALANENIQRRFLEANVLAGVPGPTVEVAEDVIREDARLWDGVVPGKGDALRAAFERVNALKPHQRHWSGLEKKELAEKIGGLPGGEPGFAQIYGALYGALSAHSHPRFRGAARSTHESNDGGIMISGRPEDAELPAEIASYACVAALEALDKRTSFFRSA